MKKSFLDSPNPGAVDPSADYQRPPRQEPDQTIDKDRAEDTACNPAAMRLNRPSYVALAIPEPFSLENLLILGRFEGNRVQSTARLFHCSRKHRERVRRSADRFLQPPERTGQRLRLR